MIKLKLIQIILGLATVVAILFFSLSSFEWLEKTLDNTSFGEEAGHFFSYGFLMVQLSLLYPGNIQRIVIFLLLSVMGITIEIIQEFIPDRGFEIEDVISNISGLGMGFIISLLIMFVFRHKNKSNRPLSSDRKFSKIGP